MNWLSPEALVFAAALPVVVLFYLLKRKRVVRLVSSTVLWQRFLAESQASRPFQKLRHNWLLWLQLLLLTLVILALTRPYFGGDQRLARLRVVILDGSASMQSTDVAPNRFAAARAQFLDWLNSLRDEDQVVLLWAGAQTVVKQSATSHKPSLRRAVQECVPADVPTRLQEALRLAETLIRNQNDAEIHLFSDGAAAGLEEFAHANLPLVYHQVGARGHNVGWIGGDVRAHPEDPAQRAVIGRLLNPTTNQWLVEVAMAFEGQSVARQVVSLPPTNTLPVLFTFQQPRDGVVQLQIHTPDDLAVDNQLFLMSYLPRPVRTLLITKGNRFLERALRAVPSMQLTVQPALLGPAAGFDLVILDDVLPAVWPETSLLAIHVQATNWFERVGNLPNPVIVDWRANHPLLRFVSFDNVYIRESLSVPPPSWGAVLVEARETPLIVAGEWNQQRVLWLGFDPLQSNWPLIFTFPIFIANAVEWLHPPGAAGQGMLKTGEPLRWTLPAPVPAAAKIILPDNQAIPLPLEAGRKEIIYGGTERIGRYQLEAGPHRAVFCVNLADAAETATTPRPELIMGAHSRAEAVKKAPANLEFWRWLALAGLLVLMWEWWYYHKRTV
ncbi:MAG: VWA domain-containing protein [Verrucomicrobiae bacterium]|nr:VWA domain-containing protein [Verrucomicrobiae bacterium]